MKLINVDDLHLNLRVPSKNNEIVKAFENSVIDALNKQPIIEAIPIEWIEEWGWKNGMSESMSLRVMIDDWEKENE